MRPNFLSSSISRSVIDSTDLTIMFYIEFGSRLLYKSQIWVIFYRSREKNKKVKKKVEDPRLHVRRRQRPLIRQTRNIFLIVSLIRDQR